MSTTLKLLFVRNPGELCSAFLRPLLAAAPQLLVKHRMEDIKVLLSSEPVDAIILDPDYLRDNIVDDIKHFAPKMPVILLRRPCQRATPKPPGIAAICSVDPGDEKVFKAIPIFLAFILGKQVPDFGKHNSVPSVDTPLGGDRPFFANLAARGCSPPQDV